MASKNQSCKLISSLLENSDLATAGFVAKQAKYRSKRLSDGFCDAEKIRRNNGGRKTFVRENQIHHSLRRFSCVRKS